MATFVSHPLLGLWCGLCHVGAAPENQKVHLVVSLLPVDSVGASCLTHSTVFALVLALAVMRFAYPPIRVRSAGRWGLLFWCSVLTLLHGVFDALYEAAHLSASPGRRRAGFDDISCSLVKLTGLSGALRRCLRLEATSHLRQRLGAGINVRRVFDVHVEDAIANVHFYGSAVAHLAANQSPSDPRFQFMLQKPP